MMTGCKTMTQPISDSANEKRRYKLYRYSFLAMLSYQIPVGLAYLAKVFGVANYGYADITYGYIAYILCSLSALAMIRVRKTVSRGFTLFVLHYQVWVCIGISSYLEYAMKDLRHLVPIGCLLILFFVFIQSSMLVSMMATVATVLIYMAATYISITVSGHPGVFIREALFILMFIPVCFFFAYMAVVIQKQQRNIKIANSRLTAAHRELALTHGRLETAHEELAAHNERMIDSLLYAEMIQRSLLPGLERIKTISPDSMFIWMPKDIVGGDIFYTYQDGPVSLVALADCTGHGVPGAFLTIIVYSELGRIIREEGYRVPSDILKQLNAGVRNTLHSNNRGNEANDGLDAAVCLIDHEKRSLTFAGARLPLFHIVDQDIHVIQGDRHSLGYKQSDPSFEFTDHAVPVPDHGCFYLKTDGFTDQLGGPKNIRFGTRRFKQMLLDHHTKPFGEQKALFLDDFTDYQGEHEQKDDITLIGFRL